jgi:hypothetical protein
MYLLGAEQDKIMYGTMEAKKDRTNFGLLWKVKINLN